MDNGDWDATQTNAISANPCATVNWIRISCRSIVRSSRNLPCSSHPYTSRTQRPWCTYVYRKMPVCASTRTCLPAIASIVYQSTAHIHMAKSIWKSVREHFMAIMAHFRRSKSRMCTPFWFRRMPFIVSHFGTISFWSSSSDWCSIFIYFVFFMFDWQANFNWTLSIAIKWLSLAKRLKTPNSTVTSITYRIWWFLSEHLHDQMRKFTSTIVRSINCSEWRHRWRKSNSPIHASTKFKRAPSMCCPLTRLYSKTVCWDEYRSEHCRKG